MIPASEGRAVPAECRSIPLALSILIILSASPGAARAQGTTEKAAAGMVIGTHGSTYGGNPFAMAAGQAVFDIVANEEFLADVRKRWAEAA